MNKTKLTAKQKNKSGWVFTLDYPSYVPFMTYSNNRLLRKEMALAFGSKGFKNNEYNNEKNVLKIASFRHKRAVLLGYDSHAHFTLEERMAETPNKVKKFLEDLLKSFLMIGMRIKQLSLKKRLLINLKISQ